MSCTGSNTEVTLEMVGAKAPKRKSKKRRTGLRAPFSCFSCVKDAEEDSDAALNLSTGAEGNEENDPLDSLGQVKDSSVPTKDVSTQVEGGKSSDICIEHEKMLREEKMANLQLKNKAVVMKREANSLQKEIVSKNRETQKLQEELQKLQGVVKSLERDNLRLNREINQRDKTIKEKKQMIFDMKTRVEDLKAEYKCQLELRDENHKDELKELMKTLSQETESLKAENHILRAQKEKQEKDHQESTAELMRRHSKEKQDIVELANCQDLMLEIKKYQEVLLRSQHVQEEYEQQLQKAEEIKQQTVENLTLHYELKLQKYRLLLKQVSSVQQRESDSHVVERGNLLGELQKLQDVVKSLERDNQRLNREINQRDKTIKEKVISLRERDSCIMDKDKELQRMQDLIKSLEKDSAGLNRDTKQRDKAVVKESAETAQACSSVRSQCSLKSIGTRCASPQAVGPSITERTIYVEQLRALMESKDFRERVKGIDQLVTDCEQGRNMLVACKFEVFDILAARLLESNRKINLQALEALQKIIPQLRNDMAAVVNVLVPSIVDNHLKTKSDVLYSAALATIQVLIHHIDNALLLDILCTKAQYLSGRARGDLIETIAVLVPRLYPRKPQTVEQKTLPLLWLLLDSSSNKQATATLCQALHAEMGPRLKKYAASQSGVIKERLNEMLRSSSGQGTSFG